MRGMILRPVLLCIGTVLAFPTPLEPHLPQTIDCPNSDIHVYVNQTAVDRKEYTFVDWNAANLQDCIEKCFGNHFCYSIRFDASLDHNCALYYFAAYNCSNQALTKASTIDYKGGSITLDCIRCPGRGDFVTAPPFSSIGEQTIVSETAVLARGKNIKGTATEITHNSENEGKPHGEVEGDTSKTKGEIEGSGEAPAAGASSNSGAEKTGEEPTASTETTLTGESTVPSAESSDATTAAPEEEAGATTAPSEGAAGSIKAPGTGAESGSTPSGAESSTEEPSTVEGSGEEGEEATSPITGEEESIGESSGEGAPSPGESASRAPGIKPIHEVEGSGLEGSGVTSPEIGLQEEEEGEAVKVDVETTTAWNGHTEQPRVCSGNLRFVPSSTVDLDTVQLLINSTKANSPAECAKICYEHNCGFAYYEPSTFICQYMANTEDLVDSSTCPSDHKDSKYQAEFRTDVASTLTCVVCAKDSEVDKEKPALRPVPSPRRGSYPACIISFQAAEGDHSSFPFYKSIQVKGLNECARHCFVGECSQSVYNPKTKECRLGSNPRDTCNNLPIIQKVPAPSQEVLLQCFRCVPEDLIGVKGTVSETTGYREPPTNAESIDEAAATANKEKEQSAAAAAAATTPEPATTAEAVTEAETTETAPEETTTTAAAVTTTPEPAAATEVVTEVATTEAAPAETTTVAASTTSEPAPSTAAVTEAVTTEAVPAETTSIDEAAAIANRQHEQAAAAATSTTPEPEAATEAATETVTEAASTEAAPEETTTAAEASTPESAQTTEAVTEAITEAATTEAVPEETTTIAGSGDEVELREPLPVGVTEAPAETTTATESTTTEQETTPIGGAEVELEEASGEEETTTASAIEVTSSGYDSTTASSTGESVGAVGKEHGATTSEEVEGSGEEEAASTAKAPESGANQDYEASTAAGAAEKEEGVAAATTPAGEETTTGAAGEEEATTAEGAESTTAAGEEATTTVEGEEGTTAAGAVEGEEATTAAGEEGATTAAAEGASTLTPEEAATTEAAEESTLSSEEAATSEGPGEMSKAIEANDKPLILASEDLDFGKSCVIKFQSAAFADRPSTLTAPFEKAFPVDSIELCATRCFQDGCSSAKYEPESKTCHLAYEDKPTCDRSEFHLRMKEVTGDTWIHCVNCYPEKSVVKDVLGSAANKTEGEKAGEEGEKSMLDKVVGAVSDVAHTVAETVTGQNPDIVLKHGCIVNFQTSLSSEMAEKVEYLPPIKMRYAHRCATKCFQEGCAAATFNPTTNECSLGYGRFVKCSNTPLVTTAMDIKETITIHCMSCIHHKSGDGGVDLVVLSPDDARIHTSESQDVPAEEVEGSGTEAVSPVSGAESTTEGAEATTASSEEGETSTVAGTEEGTTAAGAEEGSTVSGTEEATTVAGEGTETTVAEGEESTVSSAEPTTGAGEESTISSSLEGSGEVNGGSLGEEGSGALEGPGTGKIKEVPLETAADGVQLPKGVNEEEAEGKVQLTGGKGEGKFKPELPAGFSIDSGLGRVQVDGKMPEGDGKTGAGAGEKGTATGTAGEGEKPAEAKTGAGTGAVASEESSTGAGTVSEAGEEPSETGESSTVSPSESTTSGEESTGLTTGTEEGVATTASTDSSSAATPSESSTAAGETSTLEGETSTEHGIMHPAKEFEHTPLHPEGEEVEVGSVESTTGKEEEGVTSESKESEAATTEEGVTSASKDAEATTAVEEATTEEEGPAFVQESPSEDEEKEEGLAIASDNLKHREGLLEKALATATPKGKTTVGGESTTGPTVSGEKPAAAESIDTGMTTAPSVEEEVAVKSTVAHAEGTTGASPTESAAESSTAEPTTITAESSEVTEGTTTAWNAASGGEIEAMAAQDATASKETTEETTTSSSIGETATAEPTSAAPTTAATADLQHREGILEKALASAHSAATTKEGTMGELSTTPSSESSDISSSTAEPTVESTVASSTVSAAPEGTESTVAASTEGSVTTEGVESTVAASTEGAITEGASTAAPVHGMAASIDEKGKEEAKEVEEELATKEEAKLNGETGTTAASIDAGTSTIAPSEATGSTSLPEGSTTAVPSPADLASLEAGSSTIAPSHDTGSSSTPVGSTTAVLSPADQANIQHHEKGGAEFGQAGQRGSEGVEEEAARKGVVQGSGAKGPGTASSLDVSSTAAPSDVEGTSTAGESDAATGELSTSSSVDGGAGGLAREGAESTTSAAEESTVESTTGASEGTTAAASEDTSESSTSSTEGAVSSTETSTTDASESTETTSSIDSEGLIQKALATAAPTIADHISTTAVPSPADLASLEAGTSTIAPSHDTGSTSLPEGSTTAVLSPADQAKIQHREKGGAEFGQAGQRGSEEAIGAQEDEIKSTSISPVEASTSSSGESIDGGIDRALTAIGEKTTTEPPVQAVKDLLDALASGDFDKALLGKKANGTGTAAEKLLAGKTQITEQATPINQKHEGQTFFEHDHTVDITTLHAIDDSIVTVPSPQGISKNCDGGRLEFQFVPAGSLPRLNVTNDVPARTPADCARKCHETKGCTTAGFIPTPSADIANGVCLLTSDDEVCISREDAVPQHASVTAFVISCIRCTSCSYTLSHMTLSSSTAKFQHIATVKTIGECAEVCHDKKCVFAQYDATTNTCALSMEASLETGCSKVEPPLAVKGAYPVRLECVQCRE